MPATRAYGRAGRDVVNINNRPVGGAIFMRIRMLRACAVTDCSVRAR